MVKNVEFVDFSGIVYTPNHVKMRNKTLTIDISNIHSGIYILNLVSENATSRFRIFIER